MHTSNAAVAKIKQEEGFASRVYLDGGGVPTIGYGTTAADVNPLPRTCTEKWADQMLRKKLRGVYEPPVQALDVPNQNIFDACVDADYNLGTGIVSTAHTFGLLLHERNWAAAARSLMQYVHDANGNVEPGLVTRRQYEMNLMLKPRVPSDPHHYLWLDTTNRIVGIGRRANERETAEEYDRKRKHPLVWRGRLKRLKANLTVMANRLDHLVEVDPEHAETWHRKWRRDQLRERAAGRKVV